ESGYSSRENQTQGISVAAGIFANLNIDSNHLQFGSGISPSTPISVGSEFQLPPASFVKKAERNPRSTPPAFCTVTVLGNHVQGYPSQQLLCPAAEILCLGVCVFANNRLL